MRVLPLLVLAACSAPPRAPAGEPSSSPPLAVVAEGPCARLSARAVGDARVVVFGDTGYDLGLWTAGERLAAAQTMVSLTPEGAFVDAALTQNLPVDARGYAPFSIEVGRSDATWIRATTTRYAPHGTGKLFRREHAHYVGSARGFVAGAATTELPAAARRPVAGGFDGACHASGDAFAPLAFDATPDGDVFVVGQCERPGPRSDVAPTLRVASASRGGAFRFVDLPGSERIEGHVDADVHATNDGTWIVVSESFASPDGRRSYLARGTVDGFREIDPGIDEGLIAVDGTSTGTIYLAGGRGLYVLDEGRARKVDLPPLRTVKTQPDLSVHDVRVLGADEVWVEASYRIKVAEEGRPTPRSVWASALFGPSWGHAYFCDARRDAADAFVEMEDAR